MIRLLPLCVFFLAFTASLSSQELISSEYKGERSLQQMQADYGLFMQNGIEMHKLTYTTPDINGELDTASGLLVLPVREDLLSYPLLCYQHGTVGSKDDVPSNLQGGWEIAAVFGGFGYVSAAPDFLGLGESRGFHPYVHAATEASAAIDMMRASRAFMADYPEAGLNDQVFVTGYSQGGHAAAALHRELEANHTDEFPVTASAPMSGPYSISGEMVELILQEEPYFFPSYLPYTALSYNEVYGLYEEIEDFFKPPYATAVREFYNGESTLSELNEYLISTLSLNEGASVTRYMMQDSILNILESEEEGHPLTQALRDNDVYDWAPQAPTRLYYCMADDQVVFTNSVLADSVMNMNGAPDLEAIDVNPAASHGECVTPAVTNAALFFGGFQQIIVDAQERAVQQLDVEVYPNPATLSTTLSGLPQPSSVRLLSADGRLVRQWQAEAGDFRLSLEGIAPGLYYVQAIAAEGQAILPLVVR
jgi:hypothetical protein